jgi:molybdate transport system ATP-binding protein
MPLAADLAVRRDGFVVEARLDAADGETLALLGPNGAGKSTVVEALAGLLPLEHGSIAIDDNAVEHLPPERRPIGVAFQDPLLFPHLSALENVAFPLRARGGARQPARASARAVLTELAPDVPPGARPGALSGGERQRVALARAVASEPRLLLLDEPLAAVDVSARADLRSVLRETVDGFDGVCVLVAHDPLDALTLADRVVILEHGRVVQSGTPHEVRDAPATAYAADLVGVNLFRGRLERQPDGSGWLVTADGDITVAWPDTPAGRLDDVVATLRPIDVALHLGRPEGSPRNVVEGEVVEIAHLGERARVRLRTRPSLVAEITRGSIDRLSLSPGSHVFASFKAVEVHLAIPSASEAASAATNPKPGTLDG